MNLDIEQPVYFIGGGGHCKVLLDTLHSLGAKIGGYSDPLIIDWLEKLNIPKISEETLKNISKAGAQCIMAFVGKDVSSLVIRSEKIEIYKSYGAKFPKIIHPKSIVSCFSTVMDGVQILSGAIVNAFSVIESGSIVNTGSIIEHDVIVKQGCHIAPGAILLGNSVIGKNSYIGASSVVIQGNIVSDNFFIKAGQIYNG